MYITSFDFLKKIEEQYGIVLKESDSRFDLWLQLQETKAESLEQHWFGIINQDLPPITEGNSEFSIALLKQGSCYHPDSFWERDETGTKLSHKTVKYQDPTGVTLRLYEFQRNVSGLRYYLFKEKVYADGSYEVYLIKPTKGDLGIAIGTTKHREEAHQWILNFQLISEEILILKQPPYPNGYLDNEQKVA